MSVKKWGRELRSAIAESTGQLDQIAAFLREKVREDLGTNWAESRTNDLLDCCNEMIDQKAGELSLIGMLAKLKLGEIIFEYGLEMVEESE